MANARQDMPPKEGYAPIFYERVPHKRVIQNWMLVAGLISCMTYGVYQVKKQKRLNEKRRVEKLEALVALEPFFFAERERAYLNHLRANREYERDLMKNVPYWEVGTIWGEKTYRTIPKEYMPFVHVTEYYNHRPKYDTWDAIWPDWWL